MKITAVLYVLHDLPCRSFSHPVIFGGGTDWICLLVKFVRSTRLSILLHHLQLVNRSLNKAVFVVL